MVINIINKELLFNGFIDLFKDNPKFPNFPLEEWYKEYELLPQNVMDAYSWFAEMCNLSPLYAGKVFLNSNFVLQNISDTKINDLKEYLNNFGNDIELFIKYHSTLKSCGSIQTPLDKFISGLSTTEARLIFVLLHFNDGFINESKKRYQVIKPCETPITLKTDQLMNEFNVYEASIAAANDIATSTSTIAMVPLNQNSIVSMLPRTIFSQQQLDQANTNVVVNGIAQTNYPGGIITPEYLNMLKLVFSNDDLESAYVAEGKNYIVSNGGDLTLINTPVFPIPNQHSGRKIVKLLVAYKGINGVLSLRASLVYRNGTVDPRFTFISSFTNVAAGLYCLGYSTERMVGLNPVPKSFAIKFTEVAENGDEVDSVTTPLIDYANTTSNYRQPSRVLLEKLYIPYVVTPLYPNQFAIKCIAINDIFKEKSRNRSQQVDSETLLLKPPPTSDTDFLDGQQLEVLFVDASNDKLSYLVHQNISKVISAERWRFNDFIDQNTGDIIKLVFDNVVEFSFFIPPGTYYVTFRYYRNRKLANVLKKKLFV